MFSAMSCHSSHGEKKSTKLLAVLEYRQMEREKELNIQHLHPEITTVRILFRWLKHQERKEMESGEGGQKGQVKTQPSSCPSGIWSWCVFNHSFILQVFTEYLWCTIYCAVCPGDKNDEKTDMVLVPMALSNKQRELRGCRKRQRKRAIFEWLYSS